MKNHIGIMDIGSNAVRAVVYEDAKIDAMEIYNSKFQIELPKLLDLEDIDIDHDIYRILGYFVNIFRLMNVSKVICVGTAALRKANKAEEFKQIVYKRLNLEIDIITGEEEARLTAMGLIYGVSDAKGVIADLGGGSLELAIVEDKLVHNVASLSLGLKAGDFYTKPCKEEEAIETIKQSNFPEAHNLYLLGGAFRILARQYMYDFKYPLKNLHNFTIDPTLFLNYLASIEADFYRHSYYHEKINNHAVVIIKSLLKYFQPQQIIISNYGLKEGIFFSNLTTTEQSLNTTYNQVQKLTNFAQSSTDLTSYHKLFKSILIEYSEDLEHVIDISIMLLHYCKYIDNTMQDSYLMTLISTTSIPFHHKQRIMLMNIVCGIFDAPINRNILVLSCKLISKKEYNTLCIIIAVLKIALLVDGPEMKQPNFHFDIDQDDYVKYVSDIMLPRSIAIKIMKLVQEIGKMRKKVKYFKLA
jgi:exopolyphosphatase/guanosine-5'-triphosphate,3'-diphosphate pyrophosphatase